MGWDFNQILGQEKAKRIFVNAFCNQRVSHAYLFKGPSGVGKKISAQAFAAYLNCENNDGNDSCGQCPSCRKLASGNHPDFHNIEPDGTLIKIKQIRQLKKTLSFPPFEARFRVVMLPDVHESMRRKEVANSLLKTLEEPPNDTVIILTADESGAILPTIVSRCQVVPFYSLPYEGVAELLGRNGVAPETAYTLASVAEGSIGKAQSLTERGFLELRLEVVEELINSDQNQSGAIEVVFRLAEKTAKLKDDLSDFLELLKLWLRDLILLSADGDKGHLVNHDLKHTFARVSERWSLSELSDKLVLISQAQKEIIHNCNKTFVCEVLYWGMLQ